MEQSGCTPNFGSDAGSITQDSGFASSQEASYFLLSSTPLSHSSGAGSALRKRKRCDEENALLPFPPKPQFSSTLDESLIKNIDRIDLDTKSSCVTPSKRHSSGYHSLSTVKLSTVDENPSLSQSNTPCKYYRIAESPSGEFSQILRPELKEVRPNVKFAPKKAIDFDSEPIRSDLLSLVHNPIILNKISANLSNGALHRFSETSDTCKRALLDNPSTNVRVSAYKRYYKGNKENVIITPPSSPNNCDKSVGSSPELGEDKRFKAFIENAKTLKPNERQTPCPKCGQPSVVSNDVAQCTRFSCGAILCLKCRSCSMTGPENFKDRCGGSRLVLDDVVNKSPTKNFYNVTGNSVSYVRGGNLFGERNFLSSPVNKSSKLGKKVVKMATVVPNSPPRDKGSSSDGSNSPPSPVRNVNRFKNRKRALKRLSFPDN